MSVEITRNNRTEIEVSRNISKTDTRKGPNIVDIEVNSVEIRPNVKVSTQTTEVETCQNQLKPDIKVRNQTTEVEVIKNQIDQDLNVRTQITEVEGLKTIPVGVPYGWSEKEDKSNKVQTIGPDSTDVEYPSAKCVYDSIHDIPEQVQSDWKQNNTYSPDYIRNKPNLSKVATSGSYEDLKDKPEIPEPQVNSDWNSTTGKSRILNKPVIPVVPTKVSAFTNDVGYITHADLPPTVQSDWNQKNGVAPDYIRNKPTIPTELSDLQNDVGYITLTDVPEQVNSDWKSNSGKSKILNKPNLSTVATSGSYNDLSDKPTIPVVPTNVSAFRNDSGYITLGEVPQSDWEEDDPDSNSYIRHKPTNVSDFNNDSGYITLSEVPQQIQSDWSQKSSGAVDFIKNKPSLSRVATTGEYSDLNNRPDLNLKEDVSNKVTSISSSSTDTEYASARSVYSYAQDKSKRTNTIDQSSTNSQYPSAAATYHYVQSVKTTVEGEIQTLDNSLGTVAKSNNYWDLDSLPDLNLKEDKSLKVTSIDSSSNDWQYPSAKCVYDNLETVADNAHGEVVGLQTEIYDFLSTFAWPVDIVTSDYTVRDMEVGTMRPVFINNSGTVNLTMPGDSSQNYVILALNVIASVLVSAGKTPRYIAVAGGSTTGITWTSSAEPYMLCLIIRLS